MRRQLAVTLTAMTSSQTVGSTCPSGDSCRACRHCRPARRACPSVRRSRRRAGRCASPSLQVERHERGAPPAARISSSSSSSPPRCAPRATTCAPAAASASAAARPMPRDAPVTRAIAAASRFVAHGLSRLRRGATAGSGVAPARSVSGGRVVAGEAMVGELRPDRIAPLLAHGPVEAVDREEGEAIDADDIGASPRGRAWRRAASRARACRCRR